MMKFFVKDCCKSVQARVVIVRKQVDVLYRGIANQPSHAYSSLYLSNFLSIFRIMNFLYPRFEKVEGILVYICL